mmetsp:Transcript_53209/g.64140  ORF Transcript_53209/g.64140 Transcript_53209/m.64140 type:complete len:219 (-) Transcript_53209:157-813(-)
MVRTKLATTTFPAIALAVIIGYGSTSPTSSFPATNPTSIYNTLRHPFPRRPVTSRSSNNRQDDTVVSNDDDETATSTTPPFAGTKNPLRLAVLKLGMTELRYTSPLNYEKRNGAYRCANCSAELFSSEGKYDSGSGWPSFWKTAGDGVVSLKKEWDGRVECSCGSCGGHLGHVFMDGPRGSEVDEGELMRAPGSDPRGGGGRLPRFCVNGASLRFLPQ